MNKESIEDIGFGLDKALILLAIILIPFDIIFLSIVIIIAFIMGFIKLTQMIGEKLNEPH